MLMGQRKMILFDFYLKFVSHTEMDQMTEWKNNDFFLKTVHVSFIVGTLQLTGMEPDDLCERGKEW